MCRPVPSSPAHLPTCPLPPSRHRLPPPHHRPHRPRRRRQGQHQPHRAPPRGHHHPPLPLRPRTARTPRRQSAPGRRSSGSLCGPRMQHPSHAHPNPSRARWSPQPEFNTRAHSAATTPTASHPAVPTPAPAAPRARHSLTCRHAPRRPHRVARHRPPTPAYVSERAAAVVFTTFHLCALCVLCGASASTHGDCYRLFPGTHSTSLCPLLFATRASTNSRSDSRFR